MHRIKILEKIAQAILDKKGFNIIALDVRGVSNMTDFFLIAEGNVDRHVVALYQAITEVMESGGETPLFVDGLQGGDWVAIDYGDIIIHILIPELRERYAIEEVWKEGKIVDIKLLG